MDAVIETIGLSKHYGTARGIADLTLAEIQGMPDLPSSERLMRFYKALWTELARG